MKLRPWCDKDLEAIVKNAGDPRVSAFLRDSFPFPYTVKNAEEWLSGGAKDPLQFAIEVNGEAVGGIGAIRGVDIHSCEAEIGYWLGPEYWGRGIVSEAVKVISEYLLNEGGFKRVSAKVFEANPASVRVLEKAGFRVEARQRFAGVKRGRVMDMLLFSRVQGEKAGDETAGHLTGMFFKPIGFVRTPYASVDDTPSRTAKAAGVRCEVHVDKEYEGALYRIEDFERIWIVFWFHRATSWRERTVTRLDGQERGVFASRAPFRPNPIGMSPALLEERRGNILVVSGLDLFDGTPVLDIKPYLPE